MGLRGPAPTPTAILARRGSWLAKTRTAEPKIVARAPDMPGNLGEKAKAEWIRIVPLLDGARVVTEADLVALVSYCEWWQRFTIACVADDLPKMERASVQLLKWTQQLGLTPASRARVKVTDAGDKTPKTKDKGRFFDGPKLAV